MCMQMQNQTPPPSGEELAALREAVISRMSPKRFIHTAAVEDMVVRLAALYCPAETDYLRAAALLHDITKEYDLSTQIELCHRLGIPLREGDELSYKTFHARTAAALIPEQFPRFHHPTIVSAVRWHTTGREGMTLTEKLLYLADYIDESRIFPDCVRLRNFFWDAHPESMPMPERLDHLRSTLILSYNMTIRALLSEGAVISPDTVLARNDLVVEESRGKAEA